MTVTSEAGITITPTLSAELATDGDMEGSWTGGKCDALYGGSDMGAYVKNTADMHSGAACQQATPTAHAQATWVVPSSYTQYKWYDIRYWTKRLSGTAGQVSRTVCHANSDDLLPSPAAKTTDLDYFYIRKDDDFFEFRRTGLGTAAVSKPAAYTQQIGTAGYDTFVYDDVSIKEITLATMFHGITLAETDVNVRAAWSQAIGCAAGVFARANSLAAPTDFLLVVHDGHMAMSLIKVVAGVPTEVLSAKTQTAYCEDVPIEIRCTGTTISMWYGGVQVGANQTINEATINANTLHGVFSSSTDNVCSVASVRSYEATARWRNDWKIGVSGQSIIRIMALMQGGDAVTLTHPIPYTEGYDYGKYASYMQLYLLPNGTSELHTAVVGNGAILDMASEGFYLTGIEGAHRSYVDVFDVDFINMTLYEAMFWCDHMRIDGCTWTNDNEATGPTDVNVCQHCTDVYYYDCVVDHVLSLDPSCDGFEFVDGSSDCGCVRCVAHGQHPGPFAENNGHGFEVYASDPAGACSDITFVDCEAYDCRVGFSCEGGPDSVAHTGIVADHCYSHGNEYADLQGKDGATLHLANHGYGGTESGAVVTDSTATNPADATVQHLPWAMFSGDTAPIVEILPCNLSGCTVSWVIAAYPGGPALVTKVATVTDAAAGEITVWPLAADTQDLSGPYYREAQVTDAFGLIKTLLYDRGLIRPDSA